MSSSGKASSSGDEGGGGLPALPSFILDNIVNRLEDGGDIARVQCVCRELREAGRNVLSLRIICSDKYHERARNDIAYEGKSFHSTVADNSGPSSFRNDIAFKGKSFHLTVADKSGPTSSRNDGALEGKSFHSTVADNSGPSSSRNDIAFKGKSFHSIASVESGPSTSGSFESSSNFMTFKDLVVKILKSKRFIVQLRIEVEPKLQSKSVGEGERRRTDFWLTDHYFAAKWLPGIGRTLQHLCIVDYGQQAIMRRSKIVKLLSENCKLLKTLDLRNLFIDTSEIEVMLNMVSLTLRCVKVVAHTLQHLNKNMPNLQTLALLGVFGAEGGTLEFQEMKVLCLGLSTAAKEVLMTCPSLEKLQLKMQCPEKLVIIAYKLKYVAFNLDVMEDSKVELRSMVGLVELLYGATSFVTLSSLLEKNSRNLKKLFLDIPCMALAEDGKFLGVLKGTLLQLPRFNKLYECKNLEVLSVGPGLWYSMESQVQELFSIERWPSMSRLVLHMIPHDMEVAIVVLRILLRVSVTKLDVFIHKSSPMTEELMTPKIEEIVRSSDQIIDFKIHSWQKSLDFSCFSF